MTTAEQSMARRDVNHIVALVRESRLGALYNAWQPDHDEGLVRSTLAFAAREGYVATEYRCAECAGFDVLVEHSEQCAS